MEILNPSTDANNYLVKLAEKMVSIKTKDYLLDTSVNRGLAYYTTEGFEISAPQLGAQSQIVGGGAYKQGVGFAIGFDRLMLCK